MKARLFALAGTLVAFVLHAPAQQPAKELDAQEKKLQAKLFKSIAWVAIPVQVEGKTGFYQGSAWVLDTKRKLPHYQLSHHCQPNGRAGALPGVR